MKRCRVIISSGGRKLRWRRGPPCAEEDGAPVPRCLRSFVIKRGQGEMGRELRSRGGLHVQGSATGPPKGPWTCPLLLPLRTARGASRHLQSQLCAGRVSLAAGSCWSHLQGDLGTMAAEQRGRQSSPGARALHGQRMAQHREEQPRGDTGKNHTGKAATGQSMSQIPSPPGSEDAHIHTHTHSKGPRPKQQSPLGFSFIPWGQEMRICLQLSAEGLHSPAVLSSFQKQSAGTGWQCSPGHQVLSHSRIHSKKKKMKLAFALALQQKEKVTAWVWGMSALPASCRTPQNGPPAPQTQPEQAPKG